MACDEDIKVEYTCRARIPEEKLMRQTIILPKQDEMRRFFDGEVNGSVERTSYLRE